MIDAKLDTLLKHSGITFDEYANVPPDVADLIRRGEVFLAIKRFRQVTGLGLKEAKDFVDEVSAEAHATWVEPDILPLRVAEVLGTQIER